MRSWKQKWLVPALALAVAAPAAVSAHTAVPTAPGGAEQAAKAAAVPPHDFGRHHKPRHCHLFMGPHREMYFTLLAEKYTPGDLAEWKAALDERERLLRQLKEQRDKTRNHPAGKQQWEPMKEKRKEMIEKHRQLHESFTKAVASQDANAIKAVLPQLLEEVKQMNQRLAEKLKKTDAGSSAPSPH